MLARLLRRIHGQTPFLLVLAAMGAAFVYLLIWPGHWRRGSAVIAVAMMLAAALRLVLPQHRSGLLQVRSRWLDVLVYGALGVCMFVTAVELG